MGGDRRRRQLTPAKLTHSMEYITQRMAILLLQPWQGCQVYVKFSHSRVTASALLSLVGAAHRLLLPLAAFECDVF